MTNPVINSSFADLPDTDMDLIYVNYLVSKGIIQGCSDGGFHPQNGLTRAEAATIMVKTAGLTLEPVINNPFSDVDDSHWAKVYIAAAAKAGYISGYPDKSFHPDENLSRAQAISLILRLSQHPPQGAILPVLTDVENSHWAAASIAVGLESGMMGLSADGQQYLPDSAFTRINLAHALGILLTEDPGFYASSLNGKIKPLTGVVKIKNSVGQEQRVNSESAIGIGDTVITEAGGSCELNFPDGSSLLVKEKTEIIIKEARGRKYLQTNGLESTAVDWLNLQLKKGTLFGALATKHEGVVEQGSDSSDSNKTGLQYQINNSLVASLDGWKLLAAEDEEEPWWTAANTQKVKINIDMPWGVAAVRGTFFMISVGSSGQPDVSCLTGNVEVSNQGVSVALEGNEESSISSVNAPPTPVAPMSSAMVEQFNQVKSWIESTAQNIDRVREFNAPAPPSALLTQSMAALFNQPVLTQSTTLHVVTQALNGLSGGTSNTTSISSDGISSSSSSSHSYMNVPVVAGQLVSLPWGISIDLGDMNIPAGATVSIQEVSNPNLGATGLQVAGKIVDINFTNMDVNQPVELSLPLNEGADPSKAAIYWFNDGNWEYQPTNYVNGMLVATVSHFSIYGVLMDQIPPVNISLIQGNPLPASVVLIFGAEDSSGLIQYQIYRDGTLIATTDNTSYTDNGLLSGVEYHYQIVASDRFENQSAVVVNMDITTLNNNAGLLELSINPETFNTSFNPEITNYSSNVDFTTTEITISSTLSDSDATITSISINGVAADANSIPLNEGENVVIIVVIAEDGITTQTYNLTINRAAAVYASGLTASVASNATPEEDTVMLTVNPTAQDNHKIYYRVVDTEPTAMYVGVVIDSTSWTQVANNDAFEVEVIDGKYVEVVELADAGQTVSKWGKSTSTDDGYTPPAPPPVAAEGLTATVASKAIPDPGKVMLTVTPAAQLAHKIYYRVVNDSPTAMNVGDVVYDAEIWTQVVDTNPFEVAAADGKYIEVVELADADQSVSKWGKSAATEDGYVAPPPGAASGLTASVAAKTTPESGKVMLTVTPAAQLAHKIYYRVVNDSPTAMNVGDVVYDAEIWTQVVDTNPFEVAAADGKYIEVVELADADQSVSKWGKSAATEDGYIAVTGIAGSVELSADSYIIGDIVEITVTDNDLNIDGGIQQALSVNIKSDGDPTGLNVTLTETGNNTGIFKGQVKLKKLTNAGSTPNNLRAVVGDTITATYDDSLDASGNNPAPITATAQVVNGTTGILTLGAASYSDGAIITLNDRDLNTHMNSAQSVKVNVRSAATDSSGFQVTLIETGDNTGIFTGAIKIGPTSRNNTKPKTLGAQVGETITATYVDALDDDGNGSTVVSATVTVE